MQRYILKLNINVYFLFSGFKISRQHFFWLSSQNELFLYSAPKLKTLKCSNIYSIFENDIGVPLLSYNVLSYNEVKESLLVKTISEMNLFKFNGKNIKNEFLLAHL